MKKLYSCPVCKSEVFNDLFTCRDFSVSKEDFKIVYCENCGFTFTNPRPENGDLDNYYLSDNYMSHTNKSRGFFETLYQIVRKYTVWQKLRLLKQFSVSKNHLDIGCGTGEFLNACKNAGFKTRGIEPSEIARNQAINNYNLSVSENTNLNQYSTESFNTISMWHVLEHIPNLNETIKNLSRIIEKNGSLIIAVPNHKSWDAGYYKQCWAAWDVPIHLWHFSLDSINRLFQNYEFKLVKTKRMYFDSFYVSMLSEQYKNGRKSFIFGFFIGFISNIIGFLTKRGLSSTIYIFQKQSKVK
jgi:ubiquinone/menaquinone biosynthesis C-methylase UbiE|tara:strand:+ start:1843 stop:2739 length:897 start_codon:yes stop_codon:yes gene_type:complete